MKVYLDKDIEGIYEDKIVFNDGYIINFDECRRNWAENNNCTYEKSYCIASRNILDKYPSFTFYSKDKIRIDFKYFKIYKVLATKKFNQFNLKLYSLGYSTYDMS